jgi:hypothetical protein
MKWSNNNRACKTVWTTLRVLDQISKRRTFKTTGDLNIKDLTFFVGTDETVQVRAESLAAQMDNLFTELRGAAYEEDFNSKSARAAMVAVLTDGDLTVADLADTADDAFEFHGEAE